ncbi:CPBP family intramembrane glutamic endopeptidase [Halothermothrix orenii]|uniref:Abortive infection protein n=1 Tax=Halothermothrix orenii (strain H 168 / OCM 544 / DSM 9562) TaxID=373903 RepID=B8D1G1_HALOH|nr:CPBP family intramembrane glutamic endopeptidase [Halothermothrix orenii]ACL69038.1 Abortive infection protein [Halothermothrix orenii H 168]
MTKKAGLFVGLTLSFSWLIAFLFFHFVGTGNILFYTLMSIGYMFIPLLVTIIIQKIIYNEPVKKPMGISFKFNKWFVIAWLLPLIMAFMTFGVSLLFPQVEYSPDMAGMFARYLDQFGPEKIEQMKQAMKVAPIHPFWMSVIQALLAGFTINALVAFGEELGWRGFLQQEFNKLGFWPSSLLIGFIWGLWHAPLILQGHNYPQHPKFGVLMMIIWCILLSPLFSYIRIKSGSVIAAAIFHGTINASFGLAIVLIKGGSDLIVGFTGLAGFIVLLLLNVLLFLYDIRYAKESIINNSLYIKI